jgi:hypothetical protein
MLRQVEELSGPYNRSIVRKEEHGTLNKAPGFATGLDTGTEYIQYVE